MNIEKPELELDQSTTQGFCQQYRQLPQKPEHTIRFFERNNGDFYSVHGEDALYVADTLYKTTGVLKYLGGNITTGIPSCTLSKVTAESFLRDLLTRLQYRVEIWATESKKNQSWYLSKQASPGNLQAVEDMLFNNAEVTSPPVVMSIWLNKDANNQLHVGVCFVDTTQRTLGVCEWIDNILFTNVEALVIQLGVKECVLPKTEAGKQYELGKLRAVLDRNGVLLTDLSQSAFRTTHVDQDLQRLLGDTYQISQNDMEMKSALAATASLIHYLELLADETNYGYYLLRRHELSQFMRLDSAAVRALNLMPSAGQTNQAVVSSVFGLLNRCRTAQGTRLLAQWLMQPLLDIKEIEKRHTLVELFVNNTTCRQTLQDLHLKRMPDLHRLSKRLQRGTATLQDVVRVYQVLIQLPLMLEALREVEYPSEEHQTLVEVTYIQHLESYHDQLSKLKEMIELTIDLEQADYHQYVIRANFDEGLQECKDRSDGLFKEMQDEYRQMAHQLHMEEDKKIKLEKSNIYGYCFRITRTEAGGLSKAKTKVIELATQKAGLYFTTPQLKQLSEAYTDTQAEYQRIQSTLVKQVIEIVATYCPIMENLNGLLAHLDVIVSYAYVAVHAPIPYIRPEMHPKDYGKVSLEDARHPCLEALDGMTVIPNDIELQQGKRDLLLVTGPNMGGKSTFIRQLGVIALMAQAGSFVPCRKATLTVFDAVLARVGASDSQLKGVSTFMAEMLETAAILRAATPHSLVIIDELGRGTSTFDGFGLAWAISEFIAKEIRCCCLFATHFHELTQLADELPNVDNLHVTAHADDKGQGITLLYKVKPGVCDQSFGIHVAEWANFPSLVVDTARRKAIELEQTATHDGTTTQTILPVSMAVSKNDTR
ncbi:muts domain V-domain-containing protein [Syncephalis plumigaleata]|nr:muts domain V-domain-containing protein [Syncephalis plumigaleata]